MVIAENPQNSRNVLFHLFVHISKTQMLYQTFFVFSLVNQRVYAQTNWLMIRVNRCGLLLLAYLCADDPK